MKKNKNEFWQRYRDGQSQELVVERKRRQLCCGIKRKMDRIGVAGG
jgi:hypothetical protein